MGMPGCCGNAFGQNLSFIAALGCEIDPEQNFRMKMRNCKKLIELELLFYSLPDRFRSEQKYIRMLWG